ncbi:hypothetical protein BCR39DRAFT_186396 [Naematelia encephala]|uniref:Protein Zds1 C-terminal domain-containing protein n=1 Tax=Naematelia encephala TaxID=71784 RepID=A0A1Y2B1U9_9TREE|nr:hypothetical protein BCR39DRAFT_186396 [Naematelia encephala]
MAEVSDEEIAREVQTLRNLRRRSVSTPGPGELPVDPDLPPPSPSSPGASTSYSSNDDITLSTPDGLDGDNAGLFWVPAHLHPELAPGEFRAFLKAHTRTDPANADETEIGEAGMSRSSSFLGRASSRRSSEGLGRKRSMLSRQYQPKSGDHVEEERPPVPVRNRDSIYGGRSGEKGLTLEDLQKLEMAMDEAEGTDDPATMRSVLRRSLSMNKAPGFLHDDIPQGESGDGGLPLPRPGSILRRSARTKIRKASLAGDGGGHRFAATRKGRMTAAPQHEIPGLYDDDDYASSERRRQRGSDESEDQLRDDSTDSHSNEHDTSEVFHDAPQHIEERRDSDASTDEAMIFDAYRNSRSSSVSSESFDRSGTSSPEGDESPPERKSALPPALPPLPKSTSAGSDWFRDAGEKTPTQELVNDPLATVRRPSPGAEFAEPRPGLSILTGNASLQVPQENLHASPTSPTTPTSSSSRLPPAQQYDLPPGMAPPQTRQSIPPGIAAQQQRVQESPIQVPVGLERPQLARTDSGASSASKESAPSGKDKEKKGGFFSKKDKKEKGKKEKDGFLGSLFGSKKKVEEPVSVANFSSAGPAAAAALLGSSKSAKSLGVTPGTSPTSAAFSSFARYPIHVERAVYRLSHIKLANARRPLYEQVLISNLMFWYLGIIGRNVAEEKKPAQPNGNPEDRKDEAKPPVKGTPPKPSDTGVAGRSPVHSPPEPATQKKMGLTKPDRSRGSNAEAPMRAPSYGMQTAQVDSELRSMGMKGPGPGPGPGPGRPPLQMQQPPTAMTPQQQQQHLASQHHPQQFQPQPQHPQQQQQHQPYPPQQHPGHGPPRPPPQHSQNRSMSMPPPGAQPGRALSPPSPGPTRPNSDSFAPQQQHPQHIQQPPHGQLHVSPPPRGVPQSSFGPPPPVNGAPPHMDPRQRTMSNPGQGPSPPPQPAGMRRIVTDGRPPQPYPPNRPPPQMHPGPPHSGPQPGQLFQYPPNGPNPRSPTHAGPQPGQIFNHPPQQVRPSAGPQPGQVFHHPQFQQQRPPPGAPIPGNGLYPPQRLPPPQQGQPYPHHPGPGLDPRRPQTVGHAAPGPSPPPGQGYYSGPPRPGPPPGGYAPYPPQLGQTMPPQRQPSADELYRRQQAPVGAQGGGGYGHHR